MAVYGKLTRDRPYGTYDDLNIEYDYHIQRLANLIPDDQKEYENLGIIYRLEDYMYLYETDVIAVQVESVDDCLMAATAILRRWQNRHDGNINMSVDEYEEDTDYGWVWDIVGEGNVFNKEVVGMPPVGVLDDPRFLTDFVVQSVLEVEEELEAIYYMEDIMGLLRQSGALLEPYPVGIVQNIYSNSYFKNDREYNEVTIKSTLVDSIPNILESTFFQSLGKSTSRESRVVTKQVVDLIAQSVRPDGNTATTITQTASQRPIQNNYTTSKAYKPSSVKPMSYSGQSGSGFFGNMPAVTAPAVAIDGNSSFFNNVSSFQDVQVEGSSVRSVVVRRNIPLVSSNKAGNELTKFTGQQLTANVATIISETGESKILNEQSDSVVFNGKIKLYNAPKKAKPRDETVLARYKYTSSSLSGGGTLTTEIFTESNNLNGYAPIGSLGVERFEGSGYNQWNVGIGATLFLMDLETDVGYNGWDSGTAFASGNVETFDIGWSDGFSPYSRKGESAAYSEDLTSSIESGRTSYKTTYPYLKGTLKVFLNGIEQIVGVTFTEYSEQIFKLTSAPELTDYLTVEYERYFGTQDPGDFVKSSKEQYNEFLKKQVKERGR